MSTAAPPLVLLHPFPLDSRFWEPLRRLLPVRTAVLAPEFPGMGGAAAGSEAPTIDGAADGVAAAIRTMSGGRAVVCGLSMGGYVALSLAARHHDTVAALVLAGTRAEADDDGARRARDTAIGRIRAGELTAYLDELLPRLVAANATSDLHRRVREIADRQTADGIVGALAALRDRADRSADLARIEVPALVLWGEADRVTPEGAARGLAGGLPHGRFQCIAKAGHLSALERPEAFATALKRAQLM